MRSDRQAPTWFQQADRRTAEGVRAVGAEIRRLRLDAGISQAALARAARMSPGQLCDIEHGHGDWSPRSLGRIAAVLGADLAIRLYPTTGPRIHDRFQSPILAALLRLLHPRWRPTIEVPVRRPVRGVIDAVLDDRAASAIVCVEIESDIRRFEQQVRWAREKAEALPSASLWPFIMASRDRSPSISRLLVVRSTRTSRQFARDASELVRAAYPADPAAIRRALTTPDAPWPGPGLLWATVAGGEASILDRRPPGVPRDVPPGQAWASTAVDGAPGLPFGQ